MRSDPGSSPNGAASRSGRSAVATAPLDPVRAVATADATVVAEATGKLLAQGRATLLMRSG